jgi:hypothetical protein
VTQILPALIGLVGVILGALLGSWRQAATQRSALAQEELRRWQQDRRSAYMKLVQADDELYRCLIRDLRDPPPGRTVADPDTLASGNIALDPLTPEERTALLAGFDQLWRAKREVELHHLVDDALLAAADALAITDAELVGLVLFDLTRQPDRAIEITASVGEALLRRRQIIEDFMSQARVALNVPPGHQS